MALAASDGPGTMLAVKIPYQPDSVHYRAYAEPLLDGSVLDWILTRFRASCPNGVQIACVCESDAELERLRHASRLSHDVRFLQIAARDETHLCRLLMDQERLRRLVVARLNHAVMPSPLVQDLLRFHTSLGADLTDVAPPAPFMPLYAIEPSMVDTLLGSSLPDVPAAVITAAQLLRKARSRDPRLAPAFCWPRLEIEKLYGIEARRWPESIGVESARDVTILRNAVSRSAIRIDSHNHYIDSWKASAIALGSEVSPEISYPRQTTRKRIRRRTRILYASGLSDFVGAAQSLCHLIGALDRTRFEPIALTSFSGVFTDELRRRGVSVICPEERFDTSNRSGIDFATRIVRDSAPDVIHANLGIGLPLTQAAVAAGVPLVQHVRVQTTKGLAPQIHAASAVIAVSEFVRDRILELDIDPAKVEVIWNGVDVDMFRPAHAEWEACRQFFGIPPDEFVVVMIARMNQSKRHDTVIQAVGRLRQTIGRGHLFFVGALDGDRTYRERIGSWVEQYGLTGHTTKIDFIKDIRMVLHASDVLALMSKDEPLSRAVLEAMAVGVPAIVSDSGGTREVIDSGRNGFVVPHGDSTGLTTVLAELALDSPRARLIGSAAAHTIRSSLSATACADKTMGVYERLIGQVRRRTRMLTGRKPESSSIRGA